MTGPSETTPERVNRDAVEDVARALFRARPQRWNSADWDGQWEGTRERWREKARQAISRHVDGTLT